MNAKFKVFMGNLENAARIFAQNAVSPELRFITVAARSNLPEIPTLVKIAHERYHVEFHEIRYPFDEGTPEGLWKEQNLLRDDEWTGLVDRITALPYWTHVSRGSSLLRCGFGRKEPASATWGPGDYTATPVPDIVALAATPSGDGIVALPGTNGSNAFSVSTVNVGSADTITASAAPSVTLPLALSICETNPDTGACLSGPASNVTSSVSAGVTPTYSVFVTGTGTVPFDPANNRIIVEFTDASGAVRGSTSVAVRTL